MARSLLALPVLILPATALAQEGPTFDCNDASTRTEFAICASPDLAQLERQMVASFNLLSDTIGRREARALADVLLAERQACEGETGCIADNLVASMRIFDERAGVTTLADDLPTGTSDAFVAESLPTGTSDTFAGELPTGTGVSPFDQAQLRELIDQARAARNSQELAAAEPVAPAAPAPAPAAPAPAPEVAAAPANPDIPLAAQAPLPDDLAAATPVEPATPAEPDLSDALDGAELASSDGAAPAAPAGDADAQAAFDTPLSWAFMDLDREQRLAVQERLAGAGFLDGAANGAWTNATLAGLERLAEEEGSGSFDLSTQSGAALLLDYIASDAFTTAFGTTDTAAAPATPPTPLDAGDPLAGTDW